jgi:hypothetical protein
MARQPRTPTERRAQQLRRQRRLDRLGVPKAARVTPEPPTLMIAYINYLRRLQRYINRKETNKHD